MLLASRDDWDCYAASQWLTVANWPAEHPGDPDAAAIRKARDLSRRDYLAPERRFLGRGVSVLRL
ncbi:MAG: hypothetical protein ACYDC5_01080 [Candidatus Dormibacteria bacterium]